MPEQQLSIRSTKARILAHRLAKAQRRTVSQVVVLALERLEAEAKLKKPQPESATDFWDRIHRELYSAGEVEVNIDALVAPHRQPQRPVDL